MHIELNPALSISNLTLAKIIQLMSKNEKTAPIVAAMYSELLKDPMSSSKVNMR